MFLLLISATGVGCGNETPERAIYGVTHDMEHRSFMSACDRLIVSSLLPRAVAEQLQITSDQRPRSGSWRSEHSRCAAELGRVGRSGGFEFTEPRVRWRKLVAVPPAWGVTAAALASVSLDRNPPRIVRLVDYLGLWRLVVYDGPSGVRATT